MHKQISKFLKESQAQPLTVLERDQGPAKGSLATDPAEIDSIANRAWSIIFAGNVKDQKEVTEKFFNKYAKYIYKREEFKVADVDWRPQKGMQRSCGICRRTWDQARDEVGLGLRLWVAGEGGTTL